MLDGHCRRSDNETVRHGPRPGCQEAEAEVFSIFKAEALTLFKLEAEALTTKPSQSQAICGEPNGMVAKSKLW